MLLAVQKVAENAKSCSKVAEYNLFMPSQYKKISRFGGQRFTNRVKPEDRNSPLTTVLLLDLYSP